MTLQSYVFNHILKPYIQLHIQDNPPRMKLQKRLYIIYQVAFLHKSHYNELTHLVYCCSVFPTMVFKLYNLF